jgi:hypothetical protein
MTLPASFLKDGFLPPSQIRKGRRLMIGTEGAANTGKTEFILSAPGPGIVICLDRGFDAMLDNPTPPQTRRPDYAFKVVQAPLASQSQDPKFYLEYWRSFYADYKKALDNKDARVVAVDGDSDSWELQRLAENGKLTGIVPLGYTGLNASRRAMYARAYDSGKIIIATNKLKKKYETKYRPDGSPDVGADGKEIREWDGKSYERQGFDDHEYLWQIQLKHLYRTTANGQEWGIQILLCKPDRMLEGMELWGPDCNFASLVQTVYPHIPLSEWGY